MDTHTHTAKPYVHNFPVPERLRLLRELVVVSRRDASRQKENRPTAEQIHQGCPSPDYCITQQAHFFFFFSSMTTWVADWGPAITWLLTGVVVDVVWDGTAVA